MKKVTSENFFFTTGSVIEFVVSLEKSDYIPKVINNLIKAISGFRIKEKNGFLELHNDPINIIKLPKNVDNPFDAVLYSEKYCSPNPKKALASIAANDSCVSVVTSHSITDGGFYRRLIQHLLDDHIKQVNVIPSTVNELFKKELDKIKLNKNDPNNLEFVTKNNFSYPSLNIPRDTFRINISNSIDIKDLQCYNKTNKKVIGLTESLILAIALSMSAMNNKNEPLKIGCQNCVDLRKYMNPEDINEYVGSNYSIVDVVMKNVKGSYSLREAGKILRKDLNKKIEKDMIMKSIKGFGSAQSQPKLVACLSNVGQFKFNSPIKDMYIQQSMFSKGFEVEIALSCFSKIGNGMNTIETNLKYPQSVVSEKDASKINKSIKYILTQVSPDSTIDETISKIRKIE